MTNDIESSYRGNPNLKGKNVQINFTEDQFKEYILCASDPVYFIKKYVKIINVDRGLIPFELYPFQEKVITTTHENREVVVKFPRQCGKTTCISAYALWAILFNDDYNVLIGANKARTAGEIMRKVTLAYQYLPKWLQQGVVKMNGSTLELENGSRVMAVPTTSDSARGFAFNLVILDEFAFLLKNMADAFFTSIFPTISSGKTTKIVIISTPNGLNHFYKIFNDAEEGRNDYVPLNIEWNEVPGRDEAFKAKQIRNFGPEKWAQEFASEFLGSSNTLLNAVALKNMTYKNYLEKIDNVKFYKQPVPGRQYFIVLDPSEGKGLDYHAAIVFDISQRPFEIVAVFRDQYMPAMLVPDVIYRLGKIYNDANVLIETRSLGPTMADTLYYIKEYENLLGAKSQGRSGQQLTIFTKNSKGLATSHTTKSIGCTNLKLLVETDQLLINDFDLKEEFSKFVLKGASYAADDGAHDDLVMCCVIFAWATTQNFFKNFSEVNVREIIREEQDRIREELLPFGIVLGSNEDAFEGSGGTNFNW